MGRYSSIEWAGKCVRDASQFILAVTEQAWSYSALNEWEPTFRSIELLGIKPLVMAYNSVAGTLKLPEYTAGTAIKGLTSSRVGGEDAKFIRKEADLIATTFENAMQYMATNPGWSDAQAGMESGVARAEGSRERARPRQARPAHDRRRPRGTPGPSAGCR